MEFGIDPISFEATLKAPFLVKSIGFYELIDWNVSKLRGASRGNGAFEFSLNYLICGPESRGLYCPTF